MKTINQLEQEAQEAREEAIKEVSQYVPNAIEVADKLILAAVAMVTYHFALGMENATSAKFALVQKEVDDGWITWNGGECPVDSYVSVDYRLRSGSEWFNCKAIKLFWGHDNGSCDIIAYRISKGE